MQKEEKPSEPPDRGERPRLTLVRQAHGASARLEAVGARLHRLAGSPVWQTLVLLLLLLLLLLCCYY